MLDWESSRLILERTLASASKLTGDQAEDLKIVQTACEDELEKKIVLSMEIMEVVKISPPALLPLDFYRRTVTSMQDLKKLREYLGPTFERCADDLFGLTEIVRKSKSVNAT